MGASKVPSDETLDADCTGGFTVAEPSENRTLYDQGKRYARRVKRRLGSSWDERTAVTEVANEDGEGVKEVRAAYNFARHVDAIAAHEKNAARTAQRAPLSCKLPNAAVASPSGPAVRIDRSEPLAR